MSKSEIGWGRKSVYGLGAVAYGVKDNGFSTFMMVYFNQVLGLEAIWVGVALLLAMAFDAITDPFVGHLSDRWQSRLGRRHPFMYAAILPAMLTYFLLWHPPEGTTGFLLFVYLLGMAVFVRLTITFFEVPNSALIGELTRHYDGRTTLAGLRAMLGWLGGIVMAIIAFQVFLEDQPDLPGVLNRAGYEAFAAFAILVMGSSMLISAAGTHGLIPRLPQPRPAARQAGSEARFLASLKSIFAKPAFRAVFIGSLFANMVFGIAITLQVYFGTFYFGMSTAQLSQVAVAMVASSVVAFPLAAWLSRRREKRSVALALAWAALVTQPLAIGVKFLGFAPPAGSDAMFALLAGNVFVSTGLLIALQIVVLSMTTDLVEDTERETGHRAEGLYLATVSFSRKVVTGLGMFASGVLISLGLRDGGGMSEAAMDRVALPYILLIVALYALAILFLRRYSLRRADHEDNLRAVA